MGPKGYTTINNVCKELKISRASLLRWDEKGLYDLFKRSELIEDKKYPNSKKLEFRSYTKKGIEFTRWLKYMSGNKKNDFYIKLLAQYILKGKISAKDLNWPPK